MKKINKIIYSTLIAFMFVIFYGNTLFANSTYKVGDKILFGRNYEFEKSVSGKVTISGAVNDIQNIGDTESDTFTNNKLVKTEFIPTKTGVYKLKIDINAKTRGGVAVSRTDTVYFLVTENGENLSDEETKKTILDNLSGAQKEEYLGYLKKPYIKNIEVSNAQFEEKLSQDKNEYNLKIDKNAQEIEFKLETDSKDTVVEGNLNVNPNFQNLNVIVLRNGYSSNTYTFRWEKPQIEIFKYKNKNIEKDLFYDFSKNRKFDGLKVVEQEIKGNKYKVYVDNLGSMLIPLKEKQLEEANLYTFSNDGEILQEFKKFVNIEGNIYGPVKFNKIFTEDLRLFNLEEVSITSLNGIQGYKINRSGYEGEYFVRLARPDGHQAWYQYNIRNNNLLKLDLPDNIFETQLANFFDVKLDTDYNKFRHSIYDISLMIIAFVTFILLVFLAIRDKKD